MVSSEIAGSIAFKGDLKTGGGLQDYISSRDQGSGTGDQGEKADITAMARGRHQDKDLHERTLPVQRGER